MTFGLVDVTEHGVIPDGLSCCASAVEDMIAGLPPQGGKLLFPAGDYAVSRPIVIERSGISLEGLGANASRFISESPDHNYIVYGSSVSQPTHFEVSRLGFNSHVPRTEGAYLTLRNTFGAIVQDCLFANSFNAVVVEDSFFFHMTDCMVIDPAPDRGVGVLIHGEGRHNDQYLNRVFVQSQDSAAPCEAGFRIANSQALFMSQCGAYHCRTGFSIIATPGNTAEHLFFSQNHADNCAGHGWQIEAGGGATVRRVQLNGDWSGSNEGCGLVVLGSGGQVDDISLLGVRVYNNAGAAIHAGNVGMLSIQNSTLAGNCRSGAEAEVQFEGEIGIAMLQGNRAGAVSSWPAHAKRMIGGGEVVGQLEASGNIAVGYRRDAESRAGAVNPAAGG